MNGNQGPKQEGLVDVATSKLREQDPPRTARHPLQQPGAGRWLYAAGMAGRAFGLLGALSLMPFTTQYEHPTSAVLTWVPLLGLVLQFAGQRLCARAWWYVPLRSAQAPPDAVELAFWSVIALAVAVTGCVIALTAPSPAAPVGSVAFSLWVLVVVAGVLAMLPTVERPRPEPPAPAVQRSVPLSAAVLVVLGVGVGTGVVGVIAAGVVVVVLSVGSVAQRLWWRRLHR